ncbi:unnamed protein product [Cyclocybe aegerita]|uniref:Agroclavine dehydrogenase n=1 Tax=Cyclocybe aegerita TaxID=1973307 RepID=A0A8S0WFU6_CYCAE|nr:unnamed protein product [Cyclocybe aegerita]
MEPPCRGGTSKTGGRLAKLIHAAGHPFLVASRSGTAPEPFKGVKFDWTDSSTFENPFKADPKIDRIYLIAPAGYLDSLPIVQPSIKLALSKGVKRFVLLTATLSEPGGPGLGKLHEYIASLGAEYTVLRPTWFIGAELRHSNGKIPLIEADDIAKAAFDALYAEKSSNADYYLVGPELYTYDEAAALFTEILGRKIAHKHLTEEEELAIYQSFGLSKDYASVLTAGEGLVTKGSEEAFVRTNKTITGTHTLRQFIEANKQIWIKQ